MSLSALIITLNEEKRIANCLNSIKGLVDEIIVVDSGSTDNTLSLVKKFGVKVYIRNFDNYANQKNYALEKANCEWLLSLDADEEISPKLALEIKNTLSQDPKEDGFSIPRKNIIFGKFIKYSRWQPELDRHIWLWKKGKGRWVGDVHEEIIVEGDVGKLRYPKIHYQYDKVSEFVQMMNSYSEFEASEKIKIGIKFSFLKLICSPLYNFLLRYFYRLGFWDGWRGLALSYLMAIYHFELWIKVWEKQNAGNN